MNRLLPVRWSASLKKGRWKIATLRQRVINKILSGLYGQPMQVLPAGHVGLAGALVLWMVQDGGRQLIMLRSPSAADNRARLVSCMGLGTFGDMALAMKAAAKAQLGDVFAKTLKLDKLSLDRVAATPMFTYTDEEHGIVTPVQVLVWVQQVQPVQLELVSMAAGNELVIVNEAALASGKAGAVSPTHMAILRSVARHLPQKVLPREDDAATRDERLAEAEKASTGRLLH